METLSIRGTVRDLYGPQKFEVHILTKGIKYETEKMDGVLERL